MRETPAAFAERLRARFPGTEVSVAEPRGEVGIVLDAAESHAGCKALRDGMGKNGRNWPFSDGGSGGSDK